MEASGKGRGSGGLPCWLSCVAQFIGVCSRSKRVGNLASTPYPSRFQQVQHLSQRLIDLGHEREGQTQERAMPQTTVVNGA